MGACLSGPPPPSMSEEQRSQVDAIRAEFYSKGLPILDSQALRCLSDPTYKSSLEASLSAVQNFKPPTGRMQTREEHQYELAQRHNRAAIGISDFTGGLVNPPLQQVHEPGFLGQGRLVTPGLPDGIHATGYRHGYTQKTMDIGGWKTTVAVGW